MISVSVFALLLKFNHHRSKEFGSWREVSDEISNMSKIDLEVQVRAVAAVSDGCAVFLGNEDKVFVMFVDQSVGAAITMFMQGTQKERPLTHDLLANVLRALGAKIDRVVVNDLKDGTYFARLVLSARRTKHNRRKSSRSMRGPTLGMASLTP